MKNQSVEIQGHIMKHVSDHPRNIVAHTMQQFSVSRTTVLRHIQHLIRAGKIIKTGTTRRISYNLVGGDHCQFSWVLDHEFEEFSVFERFLKPLILPVSNTYCYDILEYAVTEMLNNAKDHSVGNRVDVSVQLDQKTISITIVDNGVGVFFTLKQAFQIAEVKALMFELSKGKLTSDPNNHTGEGIFFTSRVCDYFSLDANGYRYIRDNKQDDWTFEPSDRRKGTEIILIIERDTPRVLTDFFITYQDPDSLAFTKTDVVIDMARQHGERLISRSQAKRVARNFEKFTQVTLDFKNVQAIGQGFVDELFRVYQNKSPHIQITYINANETVDFMIKRSGV